MGEDDLITEEMLEDVEELNRDEYRVEEILAETFLDMDQITEFLKELEKFKPSHDDKLRALIRLLKNDAVLKKHKVMIFTEYLSTARYLKKQLMEAEEPFGISVITAAELLRGVERADTDESKLRRQAFVKIEKLQSP